MGLCQSWWSPFPLPGMSVRTFTGFKLGQMDHVRSLLEMWRSTPCPYLLNTHNGVNCCRLLLTKRGDITDMSTVAEHGQKCQQLKVCEGWTHLTDSPTTPSGYRCALWRPCCHEDHEGCLGEQPPLFHELGGNRLHYSEKGNILP